MYRLDSLLVGRERLLPGIHGLRGLAALAVVLYHLVHIGAVPPPAYLEFVKRDFGYSVHLFFVLSAFSLMYTTRSSLGKPGWVEAYFIKRFFRIAPLFYVLIVFELARQQYFGGVATSVTTILLNVGFVFGTVPFAGIVWGGWSVGVEMIFYVLFPVMLMSIRSWRSALLLMLAGIAISYVTRMALHQQYLAMVPQPKWDWSYFAFSPNLAFFCMGIYAFFLSEQVRAGKRHWLKFLVPISIVIMLGLMLWGLGKHFYTEGRLDILLWGAGFMSLCVWQSVSPSIWAANRFLEFLGERSFSIYLVHPVVITFYKAYMVETYNSLLALPGGLAFLLSAVVVFAGVLLISELTYRFIEVPGISLGRRLVTRLQASRVT